MKISCLQENLAKGLTAVGRAVATRSPLPVLSNILLQTDEGRLRLAATNLEIGVNCWIGARIEEEGRTTVPARPSPSPLPATPPRARARLVPERPDGRPQARPGPRERFGDHARLRDRRHEIGVAAPAWHQMHVQVPREAGAGDASRHVAERKLAHVVIEADRFEQLAATI